MISAKIILDSISPIGIRLTTMQVEFHRFILPEVNTHRVFSRNYTSSRAIPVSKLIEEVRKNPAIPVRWGKNQPGMQASVDFEGIYADIAELQWRTAAKSACNNAESLNNLGLHKQIVNRVLEPYSWTRGVITSTEWDNFFNLRVHPDAQPEIQELAKCMQVVYETSTPKQLNYYDWHIPYLKEGELNSSYDVTDILKYSAARCARASYNKHDGTSVDVDSDVKLHDMLTQANPPHLSPVEHQAKCMPDDYFYGNFRGWKQYRKFLEELK